MVSGSHDTTPFPLKALTYWRKNYLWGVARPAALVFDGTTFSCLDNDLATVFSGPLSSVTVKKGWGIFSVFVDGERIAYLTPTGSTTAPEPSPALLHFLQQRSTGSPADGLSAAATLAAGPAMGDVVDAVGQVFSTVSYVRGTKALGEYLTDIGALPR